MMTIETHALPASPRNRAVRSNIATETITFAVGASPLGQILVARSQSGVCAILIGSDAQELTNDLATRFPSATHVRNDGALAQDLADVRRFVVTPSSGLDLPLDIRGTPFEKRVWAELRRIPSGSRVTYSAVAKLIGDPNAARAVAKACGANAIALAIPCHRVIRNDGTLSGYRWGVARKRALLDRETSA